MNYLSIPHPSKDYDIIVSYDNDFNIIKVTDNDNNNIILTEFDLTEIMIQLQTDDFGNPINTVPEISNTSFDESLSLYNICFDILEIN